MAKYKYYLKAGPYGGKHTIGTIPKKVAKYWLDKGADAFGEYMLDSNHDKINDTGRIPEEYQLPIWHKLDNISHMSSVVFCNSNFLTVLDVTNLDESLSLEEGQEIAKITMTDVMIGDSDFDAGKLLNLDNDCVIYGASNDTGFCRFELLETDKPFDTSKLKLDLTAWNKFKLIKAIKYNGVELGNEGMEVSTKQSMECWIDIHEIELKSSIISISSQKAPPASNRQSA